MFSHRCNFELSSNQYSLSFHIRKPSFFRSLASNPNLRKSPEIRRFLALIYLSLTSRLPSQHAMRRLNCSLFYLVGLRKHVQRLIGLWDLINSYRICSASTKQKLSKIVKPYRLLFFLVLRKQFLEWNTWSYL